MRSLTRFALLTVASGAFFLPFGCSGGEISVPVPATTPPSGGSGGQPPVATAGSTGTSGSTSVSGTGGQPPKPTAGTGGDGGSAGVVTHGGTGGAPPSGGTGPIGAVGNTVCLNADGPDGMDTYELINSVLGGNAIEHPDNDHDPPVRHIIEETDAIVGHHFAFLAHYPIDTDRQQVFDRSRIEIKTYSASPDNLKAFEGETFTFTWRFNINADMAFSGRFTHMFQLKDVGGSDSNPIITITGWNDGPDGELSVVHTGTPRRGTVGRGTLTGAKGVWLDVWVQSTFTDNGTLFMTVKKPDGSTVLEVEENDIDMWRNGDFVRPKWGIYRGDSDDLRQVEEVVRFANFAITEGDTPASDCRGQ